MTLWSWLWSTQSTKFKGDSARIRQAILEATPNDLKEIQAWLKERMNADWVKAQQQESTQ